MLERLLAVDPQHYGGLLKLGKLDALEGQFEDSLQWLQPAAKQKPHEFEARLALAWSLQCTGQKQAARKHFEYAAEAGVAIHRVSNLTRRIRQEPQNADLRYQIGATLLKYGQPEVAIFWLRSTLVCEPEHERARNALAALE